MMIKNFNTFNEAKKSNSEYYILYESQGTKKILKRATWNGGYYNVVLLSLNKKNISKFKMWKTKKAADKACAEIKNSGSWYLKSGNFSVVNANEILKPSYYYSEISNQVRNVYITINDEYGENYYETIDELKDIKIKELEVKKSEIQNKIDTLKNIN